MPTTTKSGVDPARSRSAHSSLSLGARPSESKTKGTATTARGRSASNEVDVRELLKAGAHFGHKTSRWDPKMRPYIHSERGGIYIIDLIKTAQKLNEALAFVESAAAENRQVLFVGTKRHIRRILEDAASAAKMPFVNERWLGGTLTNFETIFKRVKQLKRLEEQLESGELAEGSSKRELAEAKEEIAKLNAAYGGIKNMAGLPVAVFVADCVGDRIAVREARRLGIAVIGIVDTNANPEEVDYPVPANDDAVSCVGLISNAIANAVIAGKGRAKEPKADDEKPGKKPLRVNKEKSESEKAKNGK